MNRPPQSATNQPAIFTTKEAKSTKETTEDRKFINGALNHEEREGHEVRI